MDNHWTERTVRQLCSVHHLAAELALRLAGKAMDIMTKRGWRQLQLVKTNDIGQPSYEKTVDERDVPKKYPEARYNRHLQQFTITKIGEVPTLLESMGVEDGDPLVDQYCDAVRDYNEDRIDYKTMVQRRDARRRIPGLAEQRAYEQRTQSAKREASEATAPAPRKFIKW